MLLAGGQGSRLHALTSHVAKPAVPFGGKYRTKFSRNGPVSLCTSQRSLVDGGDRAAIGN